MTTSTVPPRHICIAGAALIALGTWSAVGILAAWLNGKPGLDLTVVSLPIGYGVLCGKASSRDWARFLAVLGIVIAMASGAFAVIDMAKLPPGSPQPVQWSALVSVIGIVMANAYVYVVLKLSCHQQWFAASQTDAATAKTLMWMMVPFTAFSAISYHSENWQLEKASREQFVYHVAMKPYDSATGASLAHAQLETDDVADLGGSFFHTPSPIVEKHRAEEGAVVEVTGVATGSCEFKLKCDGYRDAVVKLDKSQKGRLEIRVPMEALSSTSKNTGAHNAL